MNSFVRIARVYILVIIAVFFILPSINWEGDKEDIVRKSKNYCTKPLSRNPSFSNGLVVATNGEEAAKIGISLLKKGGTAMDAALGMALAQVVLSAGAWVSYAGIMTLIYYDAQGKKI